MDITLVTEEEPSAAESTLAKYFSRLRYKPNFGFQLGWFRADPTIQLCISAWVVASPGTPSYNMQDGLVPIFNIYPVPAHLVSETPDFDDLNVWLKSCLADFEGHETDEWLFLDDQRLFTPDHQENEELLRMPTLIEVRK